jgi:hypothetical protein
MSRSLLTDRGRCLLLLLHVSCVVGMNAGQSLRLSTGLSNQLDEFEHIRRM